MDLEEAVVAVRLAGQQALELPLGRNGLQRGKRLLGVVQGLGVRFLLGEGDQFERILEFLFQRAEPGEALFGRGAFAHDRLGAVGIVPQIRFFGLGVQNAEAPFQGLRVKDASSAVRSTA